MPLEIKITGDQAEAESILGRLHTSLANNAQSMPLDDLLAVTRARFFSAGFIVSVTGPEDKPQPTTAEKVAAIEEALDEAVAPKPKKRKAKDAAPPTADPTPALSADPDPEATEGDRAYVLDELTRRFTDPKQKTKAKAFIDEIVGRHGGVRLSKLDPDLFPAIRKEVDTWIAAQGGNGHAV